jgi:hypothetical protein
MTCVLREIIMTILNLAFSQAIKQRWIGKKMTWTRDRLDLHHHIFYYTLLL